MGRIISNTPQDLEEAARALSKGGLVALPTETVYGLGGNALREDAVTSIYNLKGRPFTDPLICHVDQIEKVEQLWDFTSDTEAVELALTVGRALWPGPLTIVYKAHPTLPACVTGGSGFVGARIPNHPTAQSLLRLVDFPVAAPSANVFGHVSPTTARHVADDLSERDPALLIIDGGTCEVGIESTVVRVEDVHHLEILRRGKISVSDILSAIRLHYPKTEIAIRDTRSKFAGNKDLPMDGPGQLISHYSPTVPTSLVTSASFSSDSYSCSTPVYRGSSVFELGRTAVIDFCGFLKCLQTYCLAYRDISSSGNAEEACHDTFDALRWAEHVDGASNVLLPLFTEWPCVGDEALLAAVEDRLFRAASGTVALIGNR